MTLRTPQKKQYRAVFAVIILSVLAGCAPVASGSWYDSEGDKKPATSTKQEAKKSAKGKPAENKSDKAEKGEGGFSQMLANYTTKA